MELVHPASPRKSLIQFGRPDKIQAPAESDVVDKASSPLHITFLTEVQLSMAVETQGPQEPSTPSLILESTTQSTPAEGEGEVGSTLVT